ncbi:MAG: aldehyde dehydrogenase family protein [Pirellulaceae bacterium]|nr:aldehyde dehydrogenase family protein [Pirellulaceae bacterium]
MKLYIRGQWVDRDNKLEVRHPFDGSLVDTVPVASAADIEFALAGAVEGAAIMRKLPGYERFQILRRAADQMFARQQELGRLISMEEGKTLAEGVFEAGRAAETMELSAEEAKRLGGESLPLDGAPGGSGKIGFTLRVPCGVVVAITPFNFPLNLVCHKVGPALAGGNAVIVKPASNTPLSALRLVEILLEAGLPPLAINCLVGPGSEIGKSLCSDERVRRISFTGSVEVGKQICAVAGLKRVTMELGSNSPLIILEDADLAKVADAVVATGFGNAGQVCISTQRVIGVDKIYGDLLEVLKAKVSSLKAGNPLAEGTKMGPMIREQDAARVQSWVREAAAQGARIVTGGSRTGTLFAPTVIADVTPKMKVFHDELFGPVVGVSKAASVDEAIALANHSRFGLSAGIFTQNIDSALKFAREVDAGNLHINWGPAWRADLMPYGGLKESGFGKEGPRYAIEEMTEKKTVVIH